MDFPKLNILLCLSIFLLSSFRAHAKVEFDYCDKKANYDVKVSAVEISPEPVVSGKPATFKIKASSGQAISGGKLVIAVSYLGIPVRTENHDFCEEVSSCPVASGDFVISHTQTLPSFTPPQVSERNQYSGINKKRELHKGMRGISWGMPQNYEDEDWPLKCHTHCIVLAISVLIPEEFLCLVQSSCMNPRFLTGSYTLKMTLKDNKNELLTCIKFSFKIQFGSMVSDA